MLGRAAFCAADAVSPSTPARARPVPAWSKRRRVSLALVFFMATPFGATIEQWIASAKLPQRTSFGHGRLQQILLGYSQAGVRGLRWIHLSWSQFGGGCHVYRAPW